MSLVNDYAEVSQALQAPVRDILARAALCTGSLATIATYTRDDNLKSITVEKTSDDTKFFGYTICQKVNIKLIDPYFQINVSTANNFYIDFNIAENLENEYITTLPRFYVTEVNRDDVTGELSITAYDAMQGFTAFIVQDIYNYQPSFGENGYTPVQFAEIAAEILGLNGVVFNTDINTTVNYEQGANLNGDEDLRTVISAIAELTGSIAFINKDNKLEFKKLSKASSYTVKTSAILDSKIKTNKRLGALIHFNALGEIDEIESDLPGSTQYINDNPFMNLREDIGNLLNNIFNHYKDFTIAQCDCTWRGNFLLETADYIEIISKSGESALTFLLDDTFEYDGSLSQKTEWSYTQTTLEAEVSGSTAEMEEQIKQTSARIDKIENEISLITSTVDGQQSAITAVTLNTEKVTLSVTEMQKKVDAELEVVRETINNVVEQSITAEDLTIAVKQEITENGTTKVSTETGFTFDKDGLNISKSDSTLSTQVTEDGMTIYNVGVEVLKANSEGVKATDLHATTYLIIGTNSRFEDYDTNRTGCFWIGG